MRTYRLLFLPPDKNITHQVFPQSYKDEIASLTETAFNPGSEQYSEAELIERIPDFDICVTGWRSPCFNEKVMENAHKLKLILHSAGTVKPYVSSAVFKKNVIVTTANSAMARVTAECALALMMTGNWEVKKWSTIMQKGGWKQRDDFVPGVQGKTIGLIGYGTITRTLIPMLKAFQDVTLLIYSNHLDPAKAKNEGLQKVTLEELLKESDIISLQTSLTPDSYHMLNEDNLKWIKANTLLVNIGRGELIDEAALIRYLQKGRFRAILDVYAKEPLAQDSPLRSLPNVTCMPHLGAVTTYCRTQMGRNVIDNLKDFLAAKPPRSQLSPQEVALMSEH